MPKRKLIVLSDHDDDDHEQMEIDVSISPTNFISQATEEHKASSAPSRRQSRSHVQKLFTTKKRRAENQALRKGKHRKDVHCVQNLDFQNSINGFLGDPDLCRVPGTIWADKYSPQSSSGLAVHKKKVAEVRAWLHAQLGNPFGSSHRSRVLLLTGPTGVGKTAVVRVLADEMNFELFEWTTPTPTLWKDYNHYGTTGGYNSKLDNFEAFVERARKYPQLPMSKQSQKSGKKTQKLASLLLIDDLPMINDDEQKWKMVKTLHELALGSMFPTVIIITDVIEHSGRQRSASRYFVELVQALEQGGVQKISLNPVTVNSIKKVLAHISASENFLVPKDVISAVAESCNGDIRHALFSFQFLCIGMSEKFDYPKSAFKKCLDQKDGVTENINYEENCDYFTNRDSVLSMFHALGKILHNKRQKDKRVETGEDIGCLLRQEHWRYPLNMEAPELIISRSHLESSTVIAYLEENVLDFIDDEAIEDASAIMSYLSSADLLGVDGWRAGTLEDLDPSKLTLAASTSVAVRGVLFASSHTVQNRWHAIRAPVLWQVEKLMSERKVEFIHAADGDFSQTDFLTLVTETLPFKQQVPNASKSMEMNVEDKIHGGQGDCMEQIDDIEDW